LLPSFWALNRQGPLDDHRGPDDRDPVEECLEQLPPPLLAEPVESPARGLARLPDGVLVPLGRRPHRLTVLCGRELSVQASPLPTQRLDPVTGHASRERVALLEDLAARLKIETPQPDDDVTDETQEDLGEEGE